MRPDDVPVQHGFYRYSDILFHYHKTIEDPADASAFKAFVSHNALADPGHPLQVDKEKGIELYIGMLPSGQYRLLFSSAQIEYARYWLKSMGLTKTLFSLPSSDYLLTKEILRHLSPVHYKSPTDIKNALRMIEKSNKKLKGTDTVLGSYRIMFERVREFFASKKTTWLAIDIEAWEYEHNVVTECGWSYVTWNDDNEVSDRGHYIVKENIIYTNGTFVPGARDKYKFGESKVLNKTDFKKAIRNMIVGFQQSGPLFLVFHDSSQDIKYLKGPYFNAPIDEVTFLLPAELPKHGTFAIDTTELFGALEGDISEKRSLGMMCKLLKIDTEHLHNAGNDAHYTLLALKSMASGNQIDAQREERWPNQTEASAELGSSFKVNHKPWDMDSDYSDMEGAFGPPSAEAVDRHMVGINLPDDEDDDSW